MSSPLRPQYFCTRPNGAVTALVAVDELPSKISIRGVPRNLQPDQTRGMTSLGTVAARLPQTYVVESAAALSGPSPRAPFSNPAAHHAQGPDQQAALGRLLADDSAPEDLRLAVTTIQHYGLLHHLLAPESSASNWMVPSGGGGSGGASHGASRQGTHSNTKKLYCSYWLRHGECDYQQQGKSASCLFKHHMPLDLPTLEKLGLRDIPRWYREKFNTPSLLPNAHGHSRPHPALAALPPAEGNAVPAIEYSSQPEMNGVLDAASLEMEVKRNPGGKSAIQQSLLALPGPSEPAYDSSKASGSQKHGARQASELRRLDLLSFDPLPEFLEYSSVGSAPGNLCVSSYSRSQETASFSNPTTNPLHGTFSGRHSLLPSPGAESPDYLMAASSFQGSQSQSRSRRAQKPRRLYQNRPNAVLEGSRTDAFGGIYRGYGTAPPSIMSPISDVAPGSHLGNALNGPVRGNTSEPPTRESSPITLSGPISAGSSPDDPHARTQPNEPRTSFGAIGAKRAHRQKSIGSSEDELFMPNQRR
ncbi:uncharacterized protein BO80DRAFT_464827 [Aspergillus ibericus CBS 121593]|uniref:C3H1-type domain-containing protein n=1 Tax=Aspergillus ibericus CBS 121593 TaxID=1448316 RepID=A0A395GZY9_9EURO|nr:hypothetical protein BO80DRAFT_464827 [Aspergillus ibericus CBS 121593]RAL01171.1 hypothetical protein BO80DRAFT_464827 [Aspergillus ibericus CBS 121593]